MNIVDRTWTLFLDRDGVINRRLPGDYVKHWDEFVWEDGVLDALRIFAGCFGRIFIVTNQQGIGKGLMTSQEVDAIHRRLLVEVGRAGGRIDRIYVCPGLEADDPPCRKPRTGMAEQARRDFPEVDFQRSIMVGDSLSDMEFGARLGMVNVFIETKEDDVGRLGEEGAPAVQYRFAGLYPFARALREWDGLLRVG